MYKGISSTCTCTCRQQGTSYKDRYQLERTGQSILDECVCTKLRSGTKAELHPFIQAEGGTHRAEDMRC